MSPEIAQLISACQWSPVNFLIVSKNVFDPLIYYSHLLPLSTALVLGFFVLFKNKNQLVAKVLAATLGLLSIWLFSDMVVWATDNPNYTMFFWSLENMVEPIVYAGTLYFLYIFIKNKDMVFWNKLIIFILLLPTILFAYTKFNLLGYNISTCDRDAVEGPLTYYGYLIEIIFILWILGLSIVNFIKNKNSLEHTKIILVTTGSIGFLLAFSFGNVIGSLFSNSSIGGDYSWSIGQYGIFGVPIFIAFLAYLIVKFKTFDIKLVAAQALIISLVILIGSEFFFIQSNLNKILTAITLVVTGFIGINLIRSVKKENELNESLQIANEGQSNLIHIMNHQIKGYLSKSRNIFAELLSENGYGINDESRPMIKEGFESLTEGVGFVQQVLNGSSAESGTLVYAMNKFDMKDLVQTVADGQKESADKKGLSFDVKIDDGEYNMVGDNVQLRECVRNLIDNSIRYTLKGGLKIHLSRNDGKILFTIEDTGVGIAPEDRSKLFTKGGRGKDSLRLNVNSTGYGLAFVKGVVEAHKGRVWVDSKGVGFGSTFYMELPVVI